MTFDVIGDIHGCHKSLTALLENLGYSESEGVYRHPQRKIIFLGDFIDRGPYQRNVIELVRNMIDAGEALSVMGNHEFNAIAYATQLTGSNAYLRPHSEENKSSHQVFLDAYADDHQAYHDVIAWFKSLPLWLDFGDLRVVHACWDRAIIDRLGIPQLTNDLLINASKKDTWEYEAIETLLKGKEVPLKDGVSFHDKDGNERHEIRVRWWDPSATTYHAAFMGPDHARTHIPDDELDSDHLIEYGHTEPPLMLGHYWFNGKPTVLAHNIACTDYSVANAGGKLVAYRWDSEQELSDSKFVWVDRIEG